jgi:hypothetical protein
MKRLLLLNISLLFLAVSSFAQNHKSIKPVLHLNPDPGYITYNEFSSGIGLGVTSDRYSRAFLGFITIHGYQVNQSFSVAGGTGALFYNDGNLMPLFADLRYKFLVSRFTPYFYADGGFLFDFVSIDNTRLFANPGLGCQYAATRHLAVNIGTGIHSQFGDTRATYINFRLGMAFRPSK